MYPNEPYAQVVVKRPLKKIALFAGIGLALIFAVVVLLFNGLVDTSAIAKDYSVTLHRVENGKITGEKVLGYGLALVRAGTYAVSYTENEVAYRESEMIQVDNFLRVRKLTHTPASQASAKIGPMIAGTSFAGENAQWSYRSGGTVLFHDEDPLAQPIDTCEKECFTMQGYDATTLIGLYGNDNRATSIATLTPPATTPTPVGDTVYPATSELIVDKGGSAFLLFDGKKQLYYYADVTAQPKSITLESTPAKGEAGYLVAVAGDTIAVVVGEDYSAPNSGDAGDEVSVEESDYTIFIYSTDAKKVSETTLARHIPIRSFDINTPATHFALSTQDTVEMGDVNTGTVYSLWQEEAHALGWIDEKNYVYATNDALYQSTTDRKSWPILASPTVAISSVDFIGSRLFASVLFADDPDQLSYSAVIDPLKKAIDNSLLSSAQLTSTEFYSIGFNGVAFELYIPTKADGTKPSSEELAPAYEYMKQVAPTAEVVVFQ